MEQKLQKRSALQGAGGINPAAERDLLIFSEFKRDQGIPLVQEF